MPVKTCETCTRPVVVRRHRYGTGTTVPSCSTCTPGPAPPSNFGGGSSTPDVRDATLHHQVEVPRASIAEVVDWVAAGDDPPARARTALQAELGRGNARRTLVAKLQRIVDETDP
jgi:hypothetical protein